MKPLAMFINFNIIPLSNSHNTAYYACLQVSYFYNTVSCNIFINEQKTIDCRLTFSKTELIYSYKLCKFYRSINELMKNIKVFLIKDQL